MRLTKHHGLGNDFLVLLDPDGVRPITAADAVALCNRRTGIGADGLIRVGPAAGDGHVSMDLRNADGSTAEMSGNGIRCLAQAVFASGWVTPPVLRVATLAGSRTVTLVEELERHTQRLQVEMGQAKVVGDEPEWVEGAVRRATRVDLGNPHVVLEWADHRLPGTDELVAIGSRIDAGTPGGSNVEIIRPGVVEGTIDMVVYERGVGPTLACGTGACAVAAAAADWGLAGARSTIAMPGGPVDIELGDPVLLTGDATWVADVVTPDP